MERHWAWYRLRTHEIERSPYDCGGSSLADSARNLARTLQNAPVKESEQAAALRRQLMRVALELAERWPAELTPREPARALNYHRTLWKVREFAVELGSAPLAGPSGIRVVLEAFCERFLPDSLVMLRPAGLATLTVRERMDTLRERLEALGIDSLATEPAAPGRILVARYPAGEQDNSLMACSALASFHSPRTSYPFAAANGGPAYFFATAADIQNNKGLSDAFDPPRLCFIGELLEIGGWLEHPQAGPLLKRWQTHFGFGTDYLDRKILNKAMLQKMREAQEAYRAAPAPYTPADFDRQTPAIWEQLRQALSPAVPQYTKEHPADVIAILNAAWTFAQLHLGDLYETLGCKTPEERYEARVTLNQLVAEAIAPSHGAGT